MTDRLTIVGGSVASLAAAWSATRNGCGVDLYLDPARIGGSFAGLPVAGRRLDLGPRLFELDYEDAAADCRPIEDLPQVQSHRPFITQINAAVREILQDDLRPAAEPEMWINSTRIRCPLMTVDLSELPGALPPGDRALILAEAQSCVPTVADPLDERLLLDASLAQHGARLHTLLTETLCAKQHAGWRDTMAVQRRKFWMALFHSQTLVEAFSGTPVGFRPHRPFSTTRSGHAYVLVNRLHDALVAAPEVKILPVGPLSHIHFDRSGNVSLRFGGNGALINVPSATVALGVPPEQLFSAASIPYAPERVISSILWAEVSEQDLRFLPSTLTLSDPGLAPFRISPCGQGPAGYQTFSVEFGVASPTLAAATDALQRTGLIREGAQARLIHQITIPTQAAPSFANRDRFMRAAGQFATFGFAGTLLGSARSFGWDSLNDQLADALYFGATRC